VTNLFERIGNNQKKHKKMTKKHDTIFRSLFYYRIIYVFYLPFLQNIYFLIKKSILVTNLFERIGNNQKKHKKMTKKHD